MRLGAPAVSMQGPGEEEAACGWDHGPRDFHYACACLGWCSTVFLWCGGLAQRGNESGLNGGHVQVLRSKFWYMNVPKLPAKKLFFNFDQDFVEK